MWLSIGFIIGAALLGLIFWTRSRKIAVTWYSWLLAGLGVLLLLFTIWNVSTSLAEFERVAAEKSIWLFGMPSVVLIGVAIVLTWWRHNIKANLKQG